MSAAAPDILIRIADLYRQATTERSHFYVGETLRLAAGEIMRLRKEVLRLRAEAFREPPGASP